MLEPEPTFLGYRVKKVMVRPDPFNDPRVSEICSMSDCMSPSPDQIEWSEFNKAGCYRSIEGALSTIPPVERHLYTLFAYFMYSLEFNEGSRVVTKGVSDLLRADASPLAPWPPTPAFREIGYDVVQGTPAEPAQGGYAPMMFGFGCSPLSCNFRSIDFPVNEYCLLLTWDDAVAAACDFANGGGEPPPYYIVRVLRSFDAPP